MVLLASKCHVSPPPPFLFFFLGGVLLFLFFKRFLFVCLFFSFLRFVFFGGGRGCLFSGLYLFFHDFFLHFFGF